MTVKQGLLGLILISVLSDASELYARESVLKLKASPRLWVDKATAEHLNDKLHSPNLKEEARRVIEDADWLVGAEPVAEGEAATYQQGTRAIASHLQCLTAAWVLTHEQKYRDAAIRHLKNLLAWNQISCEARPGTPHEPIMPFCLSYGEHAADIGLMYDLFRSDITPEEKKVFFDVLDRFYLKAALNCLDNPPWWAFKSWSNWNAVCAGGMGIMALAFYDDRPECRKLIPFVEESLAEYFKSYIQNGGGCHEGTGYWNYGMHYAVRYLLSWENATGRKHPAFEIKELRNTLNFPLDFTGINFGDNDGWHPTGMFFILAKHLNQPYAALRATAYLQERKPQGKRVMTKLSHAATGDMLYAADFIPSAKELETLKKAHSLQKDPVARVYEGLGWGILADDSAFPSMRLSVRGGSSRIAGHGHVDLLSFKFMLNGERMITDQEDYNMRVAFTSRGPDLYSRSPAAKSTIFVDGLGCARDAECKSQKVVSDDGVLGILVDGSGIFMSDRGRTYTGRLFMMVENRYWLVVDKTSARTLESRLHTYADHASGDDWVSLQVNGQKMVASFAALGNVGALQQSRGMPYYPAKQTHIFRWMSPERKDNVHVTALNPGEQKLGISVGADKNNGYVVEVSGAAGYRRTFRLDSRLEFKKKE